MLKIVVMKLIEPGIDEQRKRRRQEPDPEGKAAAQRESGEQYQRNVAVHEPPGADARAQSITISNPSPQVQCASRAATDPASLTRWSTGKPAKAGNVPRSAAQ